MTLVGFALVLFHAEVRQIRMMREKETNKFRGMSVCCLSQRHGVCGYSRRLRLEGAESAPNVLQWSTDQCGGDEGWREAQCGTMAIRSFES